MSRIRGIRVRLALGLLGIVAAALAVAYASVIPTLERRLVDAKIEELDEALPVIVERLRRNPAFDWPEVAREAGATFNARVVVYQRLDPNVGALTIWADPTFTPPSRSQTGFATEASNSGRRHRGTIELGGERAAAVAQPILGGRYVVVASASIDDALSNVRLVKRRLLAAGALALLVTILLGYAGAAVLARRIRRLERAADRIAGGRFDEPVVDTGADELGQLASAFDRMRLRLAQLDRARNEFIANASHELRTPLFSLNGFLELLADEELDEPTRREFLETMRGQVQRLTKLATELLDLSRLDAGRMRVEREDVDLAELARSLVTEFRAVAERTNHELAPSTDGPVPVLADEQRVRQIASALIENAIVHSPPGAAIHVRARTSGPRGRLEVADDGPGIPAAHAERIFDRFYRADGGVAAGSGLGLAIARELAALMGGDVQLVSSGHPTVFALELPAANSSDDAPYGGDASTRFHVKTP